jgi:hypothetical protein
MNQVRHMIRHITRVNRVKNTERINRDTKTGHAGTVAGAAIFGGP